MSDNIQEYISMEKRRKYAYIDNTATTLSGTTGTYTGYPFQVVNIQPNDVILLRISDSMSVRECNLIQQEMEQTFPNNTVILCNDHVLKGITVLRSERTKIDEVVDIQTGIDIDKIFDEIMRGNPNDFLH